MKHAILDLGRQFRRMLVQNSVFRWVTSFILVLVAYASAAWIVASHTPRSDTQRALPMAAMFVELAPIATSPEPPNLAAPGQTQKEAPPPEISKPPKRNALAEVPETEKAREKLSKDSIVEKTNHAQEDPAAQQDKSPSALKTLLDDTAKAPEKGKTVEHPSETPANWQSLLLGHLDYHKRYPRAARLKKQEAVVYVQITISRDGAVIDHYIARPSPYPLLDREALDLIVRAKPLPPPPKLVEGDKIEFIVPIEFFLER